MHSYISVLPEKDDRPTAAINPAEDLVRLVLTRDPRGGAGDVTIVGSIDADTETYLRHLAYVAGKAASDIAAHRGARSQAPPLGPIARALLKGDSP